jgi:hypothetical protein
MEDHRAPAAPVGVHAQHRLLGHRAAGQEHGGGLTEQRGDLAFQIGHHAPVSVTVDGGVGWHGGQQVAGRDQPVPGQEAGALLAQGQEIIVRGHDVIVPGISAVATRRPPEHSR